jgi:hypothetical protein
MRQSADRRPLPPRLERALPPRDLPAMPLPRADRPLPPRPGAADTDGARPERPAPGRPAGTARPVAARVVPARPDARPMRALIGLTGVAALSALATALAVPPPASQNTTTVVQAQVEPSLPVTHVTRYVQLKPGQTAPPNAPVKAAPAATPRVVVVTTTRQSGKP